MTRRARTESGVIAPAAGSPDLLSLADSSLIAPVSRPRLVLAPLRATDAAALAPVLANPQLYEYMGGAPPTLDELTKRFESLETRRSPDGREIWLNWTVRLRQTDEAIGYTQATVVPGKVATIAYVVGSDWQDRGYGTEAVRAIVEVLDEAGVTTIRATIPSNHIASQRVAAKAGLSRTGESTSDGEDVWVLPRDDPRAPPQDIPTC